MRSILHMWPKCDTHLIIFLSAPIGYQVLQSCLQMERPVNFPHSVARRCYPDHHEL